MPRATVTTQKVTRAGLNPSMTAPPADGDIIDGGSVYLEVQNGSGSPVTVTVQTPLTVDGLSVQDLAVSVPASGRRLIGPFPAGTFRQPLDATVGPGKVLVDYSEVASLTRAVITI